MNKYICILDTFDEHETNQGVTENTVPVLLTDIGQHNSSPWI